EGPNRKRKAHAKSRKGCGNCKLRRIKCDETRPQCQRCMSYGVSCSYEAAQASLDLSAQGAFQVDLSEPEPAVQQPAKDLQPRLVDLVVLKRFQDRTVLTMGTRRTAPIYQNCMARLSFQHPFLMHMVLCLTLLHDAHLSTHSATGSMTQSALQHWNIATTLFSRTLARPIVPSERDSLWATAALFGCTAFAYVENSDSEMAWPLKPSDPHDLDWLKISEGKKAVWDLVDPTRPESIFHVVVHEHATLSVPKWVEENDISWLPENMRHVFGIGPDSNVQNNVYHLPALIISRLQSMQPDHDNVLNFLYFMGSMTPEYRNMVEMKDPRALLLLRWWFKRLEYGDIWWLKNRARVEGAAVQLYLERW
ncbi:hypothetical protein EJ04DRAFT_402405, partial [Polyplosphaeria fusca]